MPHSVLVHESMDDVGVAVADISLGTEVSVVTLEGEDVGSVTAVEDIPLGHKLALRDMPAGKEIIEYGRPIGRATQPIVRGAWVHTHNLRTMRWSL